MNKEVNEVKFMKNSNVNTDVDEYHVKVYKDRSVLTPKNGEKTIFQEGPNNEETRARYKKIIASLKEGFLIKEVQLCRENPEKLDLSKFDETHQAWIDGLVESMTSEVGRALIGLTVLQLVVKTIEPSQSIRLHKGGNSSKNFGWVNGISMRTLDKDFITPALRSENLLKLNADGFMMTRTLAENYPYTRVYKAAMRGAKDLWLELVEGAESGSIEPKLALRSLLSKLINNAEQFKALAQSTVKLLTFLKNGGHFQTMSSVTALLLKHMNTSTYAARIMEIGMHSLMQAVEEVDALSHIQLRPLSQMRSANKKHGNIGDIELMEQGVILESWDAKYGKDYLRDELEELNDKLQLHDSVVEAGFVTIGQPTRIEELKQRIKEIEDLRGIKITIINFEKWVNGRLDYVQKSSGIELEEKYLAQLWITAYTESLAQLRLEKAPIDEPCYQWLVALSEIFTEELNGIRTSGK